MRTAFGRLALSQYEFLTGIISGTPILLTAAGSSVARILTIAARRRGLKVVSAVRSRKGAKVLSARFPDLTVVSTADPDWVDQIRRAAGERPLEVIMDPVGERW